MNNGYLSLNDRDDNHNHGSRVVTEVTDIVENSLSHSSFFDKLFTNSDLLAYSVKRFLKRPEQ